MLPRPNAKDSRFSSFWRKYRNEINFKKDKTCLQKFAKWLKNNL